MEDNVLDQLAIKYGTDKSSLHHNYTKYYWEKFKSIMDKEITLLEIGVAEGASIKMWKSFFPNAKIVCIDKDDKNPDIFPIDTTFIHGNQLNDNVLKAVLKNGPYDIIIDDGSHRPEDQQGCFSVLFPIALQAGGMYVIEDLQTIRTTKITRTLDVLKQFRDTAVYPKQGYIFWIGHNGRNDESIAAQAATISKTVRKCQIFDDKIAFIQKVLLEGAVT